MLAILMALTLQAAPALEMEGPPAPPDRLAMAHYETRPSRRDGLLVDTAWIMGGQALDAGTTIYGLHHGLDESNPLIGSNPTNTKIVVIAAVTSAAGVLLCHELRKAGHPTMARLAAIGLGVFHGGAGAVNVWNAATHKSIGDPVFFPPQPPQP